MPGPVGLFDQELDEKAFGITLATPLSTIMATMAVSTFAFYDRPEI